MRVLDSGRILVRAEITMKPLSRIDQTLALVVLVLLIGGCFLVLRPFLSALLWAVVLSVATWPVFAHIKRALHGRSSWAAGVMTLLIALVVLAPFVIVGVTLADNADRLTTFYKQTVENGPPDAPAWVAEIPVVGERAADYWHAMVHDSARLVAELKKWIEPIKNGLIGFGTVVGEGLLMLTLSVLIAFFFYRDGDAVQRRLRAAIERIAPERGKRYLDLAVGTMRGVVYGILGTALAQGVLMAIGLWIAGFQAAPLLGLATFFLSPLPVGPPLVWLGAAAVLFQQGETGWAIFIAAWGALIVSSVDNFVKPLIISRGSNLPFILVLLGILGGAVAFGFIGVFLGPVLLALGLALLREWAVDTDADRPPPPKSS